MQTFLPYIDYEKSAKVLDRQRLGKQRVECKQILMACLGITSAWANHPNTRRWIGHEISLCDYAIAICEEWRSRGYKDSLLQWFKEMKEDLCARKCSSPNKPDWLTEEFAASHRQILIEKDPEYYGKIFLSGGLTTL